MEKFLLIVFIFLLIFIIIRNPYSQSTRALFLMIFFSNFCLLIIYFLESNILIYLNQLFKVSELQMIVLIISFLNITFCIYIYFEIKKNKSNIIKIIRHIAIHPNGKTNKKFIKKKK